MPQYPSQITQAQYLALLRQERQEESHAAKCDPAVVETCKVCGIDNRRA